MFGFIKSLFKKKELHQQPEVSVTTKTVNVIVDGFETPMTIRTFTVPVGGLSKEEADKQIAQLISEYNEEVNFDEVSGEIKINGDIKIPYTKEIWIPVKE